MDEWEEAFGHPGKTMETEHAEDKERFREAGYDWTPGDDNLYATADNG